jgi:hypothetical protein
VGRLTARGGIMAIALLTAIALVVPASTAAQTSKSTKKPDTLVPATSWGLISIAQSSATNAMAVGYSEAPSTEPVGLQWNGTAWSVTPMPHPSGGALLYTATAVPRTSDYMAGGEACTSKACPEAYILSWNGSAWSQMTLPKFKNSTDIAAISASSATDAWAVGQQCDYSTGECNPLILHWNGTTWTKVSIPKLKGLFADLYSVVDISKTDAWAVGGSFEGALALNWNGHSWVKVSVPGSSGGFFNTALDAVGRVPGTSEIWALESASGGQFTLEWNGTRWHGYNLHLKGFYDLSDIAASSTSNAWLVGNSDSRSGTEPSLTVRWNGHKWSEVKSPSPSPANELFSVSTTSTSNAWTVGVHFSPFEPTAAGLVLEFNGTAWAKVIPPTPRVPSDPTPQAGRMTESHKF